MSDSRSVLRTCSYFGLNAILQFWSFIIMAGSNCRRYRRGRNSLKKFGKSESFRNNSVKSEMFLSFLKIPISFSSS